MGIWQFVWNFFFGSFEWLYNFILEWFSQASEAGFHPGGWGLAAITILMVVVVGSGMTSMTIAEVKNRNRPLHCVLGCILPVVYPALLHFVLPEFRIVSREERDLAKMVENMGAAEVPVPESDLRAVAKADKKGVTQAFEDTYIRDAALDQQYFSRIMTDEVGNPTGPYILEMADGKVLEISRISAPLGNVLAVEIGQQGTAEAKTIRLPYERIKKCTLKEEWLLEAETDVDYEEEEGK
ncbi:MAG: hypothetical protein JW808_02020 [Victivallales bacterium]|nr:hypothetical protein [Victivallales bacterium]